MGDWPEFLFVGGLLLVAGGGLGLHQYNRIMPELPSDADDAEAEERFFANQRRRRIQVAVLISLVGLMMVACGIIDPKVNATAWWTLVLGCLLLAGWIALLGVADALSTYLFRSRQIRALSTQRELVEAELDRIRRGSLRPGETK